jgi:hypothetical protein
MSTTTPEIESSKDSFTLSIDSLKAYIFSKGYFSKTLLPYNPIENQRYVEVKCLLPINTNSIPTNSINTCNKTWKIPYNYLTTSNYHAHLKKNHPEVPRTKEEEELKRSIYLEGI